MPNPSDYPLPPVDAISSTEGFTTLLYRVLLPLCIVAGIRALDLLNAYLTRARRHLDRHSRSRSHH